MMQQEGKFGGKRRINKKAQILLHIVASLSLSLPAEDTTDRCTIIPIITPATCICASETDSVHVPF